MLAIVNILPTCQKELTADSPAQFIHIKLVKEKKKKTGQIRAGMWRRIGWEVGGREVQEGGDIRIPMADSC